MSTSNVRALGICSPHILAVVTIKRFSISGVVYLPSNECDNNEGMLEESGKTYQVYAQNSGLKA
jgi:hypothetical protein